MKHGVCAVILFCLIPLYLYPGDLAVDSGAEFKISSRTSFGLDLDAPYRFGLKNQLLNFSLVYHLFPHQKLSNKLPSDDPVGYIDITLYHLDILINGALGYNPPGNLSTNRYQTSSFVAGIAWANWVFQLHAGGNESFWSPWNKGLSYLNDEIKFTWAYLDTMVGARRVNHITDISPQDSPVVQYQQSSSGLTDRLGLDITGAVIALGYNSEEFGMNIKTATQYPYDSQRITTDNANGLALGADFVLAPAGLPGFRTFFSSGGAINYGVDSDPDPLMFGISIGYEHKFNEAISLEPHIGFDLSYLIREDSAAPSTDPQLEYEASTGVVMRWPGDGGWYTDYLVDDDGRVFPGMAIAYKLYGTDNSAGDLEHNIKFTLFEERGDGGVFFGLGSEIIVDLINIGQREQELLLTSYFDYTLQGFAGSPGSLRPWLVLLYDNVPVPDENRRRNDLKINLGIKLIEAISNVDFGIEWNSGSLFPGTGEPVFGFIKASVEITY